MYPKFGNLGIIGKSLISRLVFIANTLPAITYSIIAPLVLGFATIGFFVIYLAVRYNSFYVLTNNIDTKGAAYAKVLQQLMTGVYLSEVCLIGLFAVNTAPGPIVLMAVFLGGTIIYHVLMRRALKPLMVYLPDDIKGEDRVAMFSTADHRSYDAAKASIPPSEATTVAPKKTSAKKANLFAALFDVRKFKSFGGVRTLVPNYAPPQYEEQDADLAYFDPAITEQVPHLWIARDEMGISVKEVMDTRDVVPISDEFAWFNEKGKIQWDQDRLLDVPVWQKRIDY